ncbi:MAG: hypothetical protein QXL01_00190 [Thermoplasmatales archaeon]
MIVESDLRKIPSYVKAKSLMGLRLACLKNNIRLGGFVNYFSIQQVNNGKDSYWVAFFYDSSNNLENDAIK